ncbi:tenascin-like [Saccostrea echinata]|uniref:tenascin-like n=1 Tax=Saccostrea echinata TaxID=191078 RepID=UPI002A82EB64|nr:tenascin-like [Saccostrea echinata]
MDIGIKRQGNSSTCSDKCLLLSTDLHIYQSFYFKVTNISVTFHIKSDKYTFTLETHRCSGHEINEMRLDIVCGSPIRSGESFIACTKDVACLDDRAECQFLTDGGQGHCVCKDRSMFIKGQVCDCREGKIRYKDTCFDGHKGLHESCTIDAQCIATEGAGRCRLNEMKKTCQCSKEYILIDGKCRKPNKGLNMTCTVSEQCNATRGAGLCTFNGKNKVCLCSKNYELVNGTCLKGKRLLGESCSFSEQCSGTKNAGNCKYSVSSRTFNREKKCHCDDNFLQVLGQCLSGNLSVGHKCYLSSQCSSTKHADRCVDGYCLCQDGYLLKEQKCLSGSKLLGESCDIDEQCTGTKNAGTCKYTGGLDYTASKKCHCYDGFSTFSGDCLQGNLSVCQECFRSSQCSVADPAARCVDGLCLCIEGYLMRGRECVQGSKNLGHSNTPFMQTESNLALQNMYDHSKSVVGESSSQIPAIRKEIEFNDYPYSSIEQTYNHLNDNTDLTPMNKVYDLARHTENDQRGDTYTLAKALPSSEMDVIVEAVDVSTVTLCDEVEH